MDLLRDTLKRWLDVVCVGWTIVKIRENWLWDM